MKRIICSHVICSLVGLCLLAGTGLAFAQQSPSLADLARQEQERRKVQKRPARVYTNADVPVVEAATAATGTEVSTTPKVDPNEASEEDRAAAGTAREADGAQAAGARAAGASQDGSATTGGPQRDSQGNDPRSGGGQGSGGQSAGKQGVGNQAAGSAGLRPGVAAGDEAQWRSRVSAAREQVARAQIQLEAMRTRVLNLQSARALGSTEASTQTTLQRQQQDALQEFDRLRADIDKYQKVLADLEAQARAANVPAGWLR